MLLRFLVSFKAYDVGFNLMQMAISMAMAIAIKGGEITHFSARPAPAIDDRAVADHHALSALPSRNRACLTSMSGSLEIVTLTLKVPADRIVTHAYQTPNHRPTSKSNKTRRQFLY